MMNLSTMAPWFPDDILTVSAIVFGGGIIAVLLYTYVHDHTAWFKRR
jgi:hypothetical protein